VPRPQPAKRSEKGYGEENVKTHQTFSVHTTPVEFKDVTISRHFGFLFEENSVRELHDHHDLSFWKSPVVLMD